MQPSKLIIQYYLLYEYDRNFNIDTIFSFRSKDEVDIQYDTEIGY